MKFAKIYLVRHGEVKNPKEIITGYSPVPLNNKGGTQSKKAGVYLKDKKIVAIFASPMKRTQQTAKILSEVISEGKIKIQTEKDLRESGWGRFLQGLTWEQARKKYPKQTFLYFHHSAKEWGNESFKKMAARMLKIIYKGIKKYPGQNFVLVSHKGPIMAILMKVSKIDFNDYHKIKHYCDKGSVLEVRLIGKKLVNKSF